MVSIKGLAHAGLTVLDLDRTIEFYCGTLGGVLGTATVDDGPDLGTSVLGPLAPHPEAELKVAMVTLGGIEIELLQYLKPPTVVEYHGDPSRAGSSHLAFEVDDIDRAYAELKQAGVDFHTEVNDCVREGELVWRWVYLRDPDGVCIELVEFNR